jgi:hypothetical protein
MFLGSKGAAGGEEKNLCHAGTQTRAVDPLAHRCTSWEIWVSLKVM